MKSVKRPDGSGETPPEPLKPKKESEAGFEKHVPPKDFRTSNSVGWKDHVWTVYETKGLWSAIMALFAGIFGPSKPDVVQVKATVEKPKDISREIEQLALRLSAVQHAPLEKDPTPLFNFLADIAALEQELPAEREDQRQQLNVLKEAANQVIDQQTEESISKLDLKLDELNQLAAKAKVTPPSNKPFGETAKALRGSLQEKIEAIEQGKDERELAVRVANEKLAAGEKQLKEKSEGISKRESLEKAAKEEELTNAWTQNKEDIERRIGVEEETIRVKEDDIKKIEDLQYGFWARSLTREEEGQISGFRKQIMAIRKKISSEMDPKFLEIETKREAAKINAFEEIEKKYQAEREALKKETLASLVKEKEIADVAQQKARDEILRLKGDQKELEGIIARKVFDNKSEIEPIVRLQFYKKIFTQHQPEKTVESRAFILSHLPKTDKGPIYDYIRDLFGATSNILEAEIDDISAQTMVKQTLK